MNNFENTAAYIISSDTVARKQSTPVKRQGAEIFLVKQGLPKKKTNAGHGKTGVELAFYLKASYQKLNTTQKAKLYKWHTSNKKDKPAKKPAEINSAVAAPVACAATALSTDILQ